MEILPIYPETPYAEIELVKPTRLNKNCQRCKLHEDAENVCVMPGGEVGGVLFVGENPERKAEEVAFSSRAGSFVRRQAQLHTKGPIMYDYATRCYGRYHSAVGPAEVQACRGYLADVIRNVKPTRIIALGAKAVQSIFDRVVPIMSVRRGYGWLYNDDITDSSDPIPVFFLNHLTTNNTIIKRWFQSDIKWAMTCDVPQKPPWEGVCRIIETVADALEAEDDIRDHEWFSFDCETAGVMFDPEFTLVSLAINMPGSDDAWVWDKAALANPKLTAGLKEIMVDPTIGKNGQNLKYDVASVRNGLGVVVQNHYSDTRLKRKMLIADADGRLEVMCELVGMGGMKGEAKEELKIAQALITKERAKSAKKGMLLPGIDPILEAACARPNEPTAKYAYGLLKRATCIRYNARDTVATTRLEVRLDEAMSAVPPLKRVWNRVVSKAGEAVEQIEAWGIGASRENVEMFDRYLEMKQQEMSIRFEQYDNFNPNSTQSIAELLFDRLGLPASKLTDKGAPSTDKEALDALKGEHPIIADLLEWRGVAKLRGTYATGMMTHIRSDGRIHPSLKIDGTRTGRLSCVEPNLQNIRRAEDAESKMARDVFIAYPGHRLLQFDYSQLELRVATILCKDPKMKAIWDEGVDYHLKTAQLISMKAWNIAPEEVQYEHRTAAKTVNFAVLYGMGAFGLARKLNITPQEAEAIINAIMGEFTHFAAWCAAQEKEARDTGFVWTWWDGERARRRPLWGIGSQDPAEVSNAVNGSKNTPVQGTASEFCLASLIECVKWIKMDRVQAKLVLTVHDSIMLEAKNSATDLCMKRVPEIMRDHNSDGIPLVIDTEEGDAWGSLKKVS